VVTFNMARDWLYSYTADRVLALIGIQYPGLSQTILHASFVRGVAGIKTYK
jgi:hypothetical protein